MHIDWNAIATALLAPVAVLFVKTMLDFHFAEYLVRYLYWIPVRSILRDKPERLSGDWEQEWGSGGSANYQAVQDRHGNTHIYQLGRHCYAEFAAQQTRYALFGQIRGSYFVGTWRDISKTQGYFGTFQLRIVDSDTLEGKWIGHSAQVIEIRSDNWSWKRIH
jgi:hypothetical protein